MALHKKVAHVTRIERSRLPDALVGQVVDATSIVDVIGAYVALAPAGADFLGLCPFHAEQTPSFRVSPAKRWYQCFGCGASGNTLNFLVKHGGMKFMDALRVQAGEAGITLPGVAGATLERPQCLARATITADSSVAAVAAPVDPAAVDAILDVLALAAQHYYRELKSSERAVAYLRGQRELTGQTAKRFSLGYAPAAWHSLKAPFAAGYAKSQPLLDSGLVCEKTDALGHSRRYDRFRDRIMFPVRDLAGHVIAFGGRELPPSTRAADGEGTVPAGAGRYINTPETPVFLKWRVLYGIYEAQEAIRELGYAIVVEGQFDVLSLAQAGFLNVVCTMGTALSRAHLEQLADLAGFAGTGIAGIVFSFDGDAAGRRATERACELAQPLVDAGRLRCGVVAMPDDSDPDEYVRRAGSDSYQRLLDAALMVDDLSST